jgi:NAD(P)-dependent dehydrogenase (short-subunit alcohol dehydrogenase family)
MSDRTWFITGASRGLGRAFAHAALAAGDRVAATARDTSDLDELVQQHGDAVLPVELEVTDRAACFAAINATHERFGRLDVVVNNAGYGVSGAIEELSEEQARRQVEVNLLGALWVTQAALPIMREQRSGWIVQVSSIGGLAAFPLTGIYHASKWALEGFSESLRQEVEPFGVKVLMVEPSGFRTDWAGSSMSRAAPSSPPRRCWTRSTATTRRSGCSWAMSPTTSRSTGTSSGSPNSAPGRRPPAAPTTGEGHARAVSRRSAHAPEARRAAGI